MKIGILGLGEVGQAIKEVYKKAGYKKIGECDLKLEINTIEKYCDYLHICIPYGEKFEKVVKGFYKKFIPNKIIIHSTVKVGTTKNLNYYLNNRVVHSPIRGVHPKLYEGVKTFIKYVGADDIFVGTAIVKHFRDLGLKSFFMPNSETTELAKLLSTTYYGMCIAFHEYASRLCDSKDLNFENVMTRFNESYNEGYAKLNKKNVIRPTLYPPKGKIGGHCVGSNAKILHEQFGQSNITDLIESLS